MAKLLQSAAKIFNVIDKVIYFNEKIFWSVGLKKFAQSCEIIRLNGGLLNTAKRTLIQDDLKKGELVGEDEFGNKYYQNDYYQFGRNRWVQYADHVGLNYDASQIPAEWYGWVHYKTDYIPSEDPGRPSYPWMLTHTENLTGTKGAYVGYSTAKPKISLWQPKSVNRT